MNERLILLRKRLGLTQTEIGDKLGMSRSAIANLELGRVDFSEMTILHICRTFCVNQIWFRTGEGEMFEDSTGDFIADMAMKYQLSEFQQTLVRAVYEMPPELQRMAVEVARKIAADSYRSAEIDETEHARIERITNQYLDAYDAQQPSQKTDEKA